MKKRAECHLLSIRNLGIELTALRNDIEELIEFAASVSRLFGIARNPEVDQQFPFLNPTPEEQLVAAETELFERMQDLHQLGDRLFAALVAEYDTLTPSEEKLQKLFHATLRSWDAAIDRCARARGVLPNWDEEKITDYVIRMHLSIGRNAAAQILQSRALSLATECLSPDAPTEKKRRELEAKIKASAQAAENNVIFVKKGVLH